MKLVEALPELAADLEGGLVRLGRGDLAGQLKDASLERWVYDDFADTTYLYLTAPPVEPGDGERLSLYDELGMSVDMDARGRLTGIEVLEGQALAGRLEAGR